MLLRKLNTAIILRLSRNIHNVTGHPRIHHLLTINAYSKTPKHLNERQAYKATRARQT